MTENQKSKPQFAICINTDDPDLLTPRMIYEILPDESAAKSNYIRVIDNEGEDWSTKRPTNKPSPRVPTTVSPTIDLLGRLEDLKETYYCAVSWDQIDCENAIPCPSGDSKGKQTCLFNLLCCTAFATVLLNVITFILNPQSAQRSLCHVLVAHLARGASRQ